MKKVQYRVSNGYKYKNNSKKNNGHVHYLNHLTIKESEGIHPLDNPILFK